MALRRHHQGWLIGFAVSALALGACASGPATSTRASTSAATSSSAPAGSAASTSGTHASAGASGLSYSATSAGHVVVVVLENHSYSDVIGNRSAPYLNSLARRGVNLTNIHAITHPSQPNYIALFSGSRHGVTGDACPQRLTGGNLGNQLLSARLTFAGYSEGLPRTGSTICNSGAYARRHNPWADFGSLPASTNRPFTSFPRDYATLPTVSFVVPDVNHDMHDGTVATGDTWVRTHLSQYATWAATHHSLLIVTWDEDDRGESNRIPTIVVGAGVRARPVSTAVTLYSVLRLIEDRYRLPRLGGAARAASISLS